MLVVLQKVFTFFNKSGLIKRGVMAINIPIDTMIGAIKRGKTLVDLARGSVRAIPPNIKHNPKNNKDEIALNSNLDHLVK